MKQDTTLIIAVISVLLVAKISAKHGDGSASASKRIIGGTTSRHSKMWTFLANIQIYKGPRKFEHHCIGALINKHWVITSAECVVFHPNATFHVTLGDYTLKYYESGEVRHDVLYYHVHDRYFADRGLNYDVALLKIDPPAIISTYHAKRSVIGLPRLYEQVPVGKECVTISWGAFKPNSTKSSNFNRHVTLPIVAHKNCSNHYKGSRIISRFASMCAGDLSSNKSTTCAGDSGGPLVCKNAAGKWILQGIVSSGDKSCRGGVYSVFVRVSSFIEWIEWKTSQPCRIIAKDPSYDFHYYCEEWKEAGRCNLKFINEYCQKTCKGITSS